MKDTVQMLIEVLLDKNLREDERDDAAMDLGEYNDLRALKALIKVASDPDENMTVIDSCAESIGSILIERNEFDASVLDGLIPLAKELVIDFIRECKPDLIR
jgi:HEAT repeat protein